MNLTLKNIPDPLYLRLKEIAARPGQPTEPSAAACGCHVARPP